MLATAAGALHGARVDAQEVESTYDFDIREDTLGAALAAIARRTDLVVLYPNELANKTGMKPVVGRYTVREAIRILFRDTHFSGGLTEHGVIYISVSENKQARSGEDDMVERPGRRSVWATVAAFLFGSGVHAQNVSVGSGSGIEEVVVTAQKREERLLDVPVSVTSVNSESLANQNAVGLADYYYRVPGLAVSSTSTSGISLRGITTGGNGTSPTVAVVVDDAPFGGTSYLASPPFPDFDPSELDRIEVLRGPQGTLYGASSTGGLIKLVTKAPDPDSFSGRVEALGNLASGGSEGYAVRGAVNVPIVTGRAAVRASMGYREDPPYVDDIHPGVAREDVNSARTLTGRLAASVKATDALTLDVSGLYQRTRSAGNARIELNSLPSGAMTDYRPRYGDFTINSLLDEAESEFRMAQAKLAYDFDGSELTSITAWSQADTPSMEDRTSQLGVLLSLYPAAPPGSVLNLVNSNTTEKFSQELRFSSRGASTLEWIVGGFYTKERTSAGQALVAAGPSGATIATIADFQIPSTFKEWAAFGDITYHINEQFNVQVGGRWSRNEQTITQRAVIDAAATPVFPPSPVIGSDSSESVETWLISPQYKFSPDLMAYARVATGYRPGGPNPPVGDVPLTYGSDSVTSYELGIKGAAFERNLSFDLAVYQIDWDKIQILATQSSGIGFNVNGGSARSRGLETAVQFSPWQGMTATATSTWNDAELTEAFDSPPPGGTSALGSSGDRLPYGARYMGGIALEQRWPLFFDWSGSASVSYNHVGERLGLFPSTAAPVTQRSRLALPAYDTVDLNFGAEKNGWHFNLFVRNLTDERGMINLDNRGGTSPAVIATYLRPRIYGLSTVKEF